MYSKADRVTVHAEINADHVVRNGAAPDRVITIPNWVDTASIRPGGSGDGFKRRHELGDGFIASFAGVLGYSQDLEVVLKAAKIVQDRQDIRWVIVGDGVKKGELERMAQQERLANVTFVPMVPREEYPEVLQASDVSLATLKADVKTSVVPSKILSIMAAGKPVVATMNPDGDAPRLIRDAQCGYALPAEDPEALAQAICELQRDPDLRRRLGSNGRAYVEANLSQEKAARRYVDLFQDILGQESVSVRHV